MIEMLNYFFKYEKLYILNESIYYQYVYKVNKIYKAIINYKFIYQLNIDYIIFFVYYKDIKFYNYYLPSVNYYFFEELFMFYWVGELNIKLLCW
jgi:hypothetical protein